MADTLHRPAGSPASTDPFVIGPTILAEGRTSAPLSGLSFAAKDLYDVRGTRTGAGNPARLASVQPADKHADAVQAFLDSGATLIGKTVTDELAFSLSGTNVHYGTPYNPAAPDRVPGGSSSGSASAVASQSVDFALGTDTGGSTRVPASYCGIFGLRTTHGRISRRGTFLLAPSFCTIGLFTRHGRLLAEVWRALRDRASDAGYQTGVGSSGRDTTELVLAPELLAFADLGAQQALLEASERATNIVGVPLRRRSFATREELIELRRVFRAIQMYEAWELHGEWLREGAATLGAGIAARFATAATITASQVEAARAKRRQFHDEFVDYLGSGSFLLQPAASGPAPLISLQGPAKEDLRDRTLTLTAPAGLVGAPVISLPMGRAEALPVGLAVVGLPGDDDELTRLGALVDSR